jgi:hypothetical protein
MKKKPSKTTPKKTSNKRKPTQAKAGTPKPPKESTASRSASLSGGPGIRDGRGSDNPANP